MKAGSITRTHIALVLILIVGAGAYLYFKEILPKHQVANKSAIAAQEAATKRLADVTARQGQVTQGKIDPTALARIMTAGMAVPPKENIAASMLEIQDLAARSGFNVSSIGSEAAAEGGATNIQLDGSASFQNVSFFLSRLQRLVEQRSDKVYVRGRLYNVSGITLGTGEGSSGANEDGFDDGLDSELGGETTTAKAGELQVSITIQMFSSGDATGIDPAASAAGGEGAPASGAPASGAGTEGAPASGAPASGAPASSETPAGGSESNVDTGQAPAHGQVPASGVES